MNRFQLVAGMMLSTLVYSAPSFGHGKLDANELEEMFANTTQMCRKEKDQSTCTTYFSADGVIKRRLHETDVRREGTWEAEVEHDQLCITWAGKTKALCFDVYRNKDGTLDMYKGGRHLSSVIQFTPGNVEGL